MYYTENFKQVTGTQVTCKKQFINEEYKKKFISVMPSNVFGVNDNFDPDNSHVLGALLRKIYHAKLNAYPWNLRLEYSLQKRIYQFL